MNLILLKSFLLPTLCIHFAWLGVMAAAATAAVALDIFGTQYRHRGLAAAILDRVGPGPGEAALLGLTATLILLCVQLGYLPPASWGPFWGGTLAPLLAGLSLLTLYRRLLRQGSGLPLRPCCGLAGIALILASSFLLFCGSGLLVMPEKWPIPEAGPFSLLSWSGTGRYLEFTSLSFVAAGAVILQLSERSAHPDEALAASRLGGGMALIFLLAWPPAVLFTLFNLPAIALSGPAWLLAAVTIVLAATGAWLTVGILCRPEKYRAWPLLAISLALFPLWIANDHISRESVLDEATREGVAAIPPSAPAAVKKPPAGVAQVSGAAVFEKVCMACHRFDEKLVGPPLNTVVPKYRKEPKALQGFIRNPVKRDPAYPAMPKLPLSEAEIEAVAAYLLEKGAP